MIIVLFIWGELVRVGGLAQLDEMIFIPRSYEIFYLTSLKNFVMSLEKNCFGYVILSWEFSFK